MSSAQDLLAFIDSGEKSGGILIGLILYVTWTFSLTAFSILYLFCSFGVLIFMYWEEFHFFFFLGIFFIYISSAIPKVPYNPPPTALPTHSHFLVLAFPCTEHIKFARPRGLSFHWWLTRPSSDTYAARVKSSRLLVSSYCSNYRVADPFSSLGTFSSSSIGGPVMHPIADCEYPLLCLLGPGIASQ